jgi:DNA-binding transcriptional MocR family regulator
MQSITINRLDSVPLAEQIYRELSKQITHRALRPGARLPSIREFARGHGVSTVTVVEAYERLEHAGLVVSRKGSGFYVTPRSKPKRSADTLDLNRAEDILWIIRNTLGKDTKGIRAGAGWLPADWLNDGMLQKAIRRVAEKQGSDLFEYGDPGGYPRLRDQLAEKLRASGVNATARQIVTTQGATRALDLIGRLLIKPNDVVLVEDPGYYVFFGYVKSLGATVFGVPRNSDGPDTEALEALVKEHRPKLFFTMSVVHNPTGTNTSQAKAYRILQLAEKYDFMVIEDDVYGDFHPRPITRLASLDQLDRVIYVSGFSKTVSTSLRSGFLACREDLIQELLDVKLLSGLSTCGLTERVISEILINGSYDRHIELLRTRLDRARSLTLTKLRAANLLVPLEPEAGPFVWAKLKGEQNSALVASTAVQHGIVLGPGHLFRPHHEPSAWIRFNVAYCDDPKLYQFLGRVSQREAVAS